jgi:hypothetical protein
VLFTAVARVLGAHLMRKDRDCVLITNPNHYIAEEGSVESQPEMLGAGHAEGCLV